MLLTSALKQLLQRNERSRLRVLEPKDKVIYFTVKFRIFCTRFGNFNYIHDNIVHLLSVRL